VCELLLKALKAILSVPKNAWRVLTMAPETQLSGVAISGDQVGSAVVAGWPAAASSSPKTHCG
jgi:hypothetical protein